MKSKMTTKINRHNEKGDFRHPDFLQSLNLDIKEREILKLFVKMEDKREIRKQPYVFTT